MVLIEDAIATRRSKGKMLQKVPPRELIERILQAAVYAPNHHQTQPWRFFVLEGDARVRFGEALAEAVRQREKGIEPGKFEGLLLAERAKPLRSPVLVLVGVQSERDDPITRREDLQAASAALQNMLLSAHSLGLAAIWRTGDGAYDDFVKAHFGLRPQDEIAGILYLGYADLAFPEPKTRQRDFAARTEWRA